MVESGWQDFLPTSVPVRRRARQAQGDRLRGIALVLCNALVIPAARRADWYARRVGVAAAREINEIPAARQSNDESRVRAAGISLRRRAPVPAVGCVRSHAVGLASFTEARGGLNGPEEPGSTAFKRSTRSQANRLEPGIRCNPALRRTIGMASSRHGAKSPCRPS